MNSKRILPLLAVLLLAVAAPALATVTVTVSSPANNANVPTTFNVVASARTPRALSEPRRRTPSPCPER